MVTKHLLDVRNLWVKYGPVEAVKGTNFWIDKGEIVSLLGSNGAGKSSTLRAISALVKSKGRIIFNGKDISEYPAYKIPFLGLSMCPEGRGVFSDLTVEENLALGAYTVRKNRKKVRENFDKVYSLFKNLADKKLQLAGTLSGGEQQMLSIGRALMSEPELLMLDEPSLGLSPKLVDMIFNILKEINRSGTTIFLVEQNAAMALALSYRLYVMQTGKIVAFGTPKQLDLNTLKTKYFGGA